MIIFSKREKKILSKQTHTGPYNYDVHIEVGWGGGGGVGGWESLKFYQVFAIFFKQKIYCSISQMEGVGVTQLVI